MGAGEVSYSGLEKLPRTSVWNIFDYRHDMLFTTEPSGRGLEISACRSYTSEELDYFGVQWRHGFDFTFYAPEPSYDCILINNATILGDTGAIRDSNGELLIESLFPSFRKEPFVSLAKHPGFGEYPTRFDFDEDVFVLFDGGGFHNYWHFHIDILPTVAFAKRLGVLDRIKFAVPKQREWHKAALARLGVAQSQVVELKNAYNVFKRCFLFSTIYNPMLTPPNEYARETFRLLNLGTSSHISPNKMRRRFVYIARTDSVARRLINEQELIKALSAIGFEIAVMSTMTYEEQIELFEQSCIVVGLHGAGLTNVIYCGIETLVVEIFPYALLQAPHYNYLCKSIGLKYEMFVSKIPPPTSVHESWALEVRDFLFRLSCMMDKYRIAERDGLIGKIGPIADIRNGPSTINQRQLSDLEASGIVSLFGFSDFEPWGRWICERRAAIRFNVDLPKNFQIVLQVRVHAPALADSIVITCGKTAHHVTSTLGMLTIRVDNPDQCRTIWIDAPGATSPQRSGGGGDARLLSIGIELITIKEFLLACPDGQVIASADGRSQEMKRDQDCRTPIAPNLDSVNSLLIAQYGASDARRNALFARRNALLERIRYLDLQQDEAAIEYGHPPPT